MVHRRLFVSILNQPAQRFQGTFFVTRGEWHLFLNFIFYQCQHYWQKIILCEYFWSVTWVETGRTRPLSETGQWWELQPLQMGPSHGQIQRPDTDTEKGWRSVTVLQLGSSWGCSQALTTAYTSSLYSEWWLKWQGINAQNKAVSQIFT